LIVTTRRDWTSFEHDGDTWLFDLTFLLSSWRCIYGNGCRGVLEEDATELEQGCCTYGAHFADKADRVRVRGFIKELDDSQWQNRREARKLGGPIHKNSDGDWVTRQHEGACIMLNGPGFARGAGCALHVGAMDAGVNPLEWKPEVCWQVPLRLSHHTDEVGHTTYTLREWTRRDWGEGGFDFHWWCTESAEAFGGDAGVGNRVVDHMGPEIVAMVGEGVYAELLSQIQEVSSDGIRVANPTPVRLTARGPSKREHGK
jgi:hypothetical protein